MYKGILDVIVITWDKLSCTGPKAKSAYIKAKYNTSSHVTNYYMSLGQGYINMCMLQVK